MTDNKDRISRRSLLLGGATVLAGGATAIVLGSSEKGTPEVIQTVQPKEDDGVYRTRRDIFTSAQVTNASVPVIEEMVTVRMPEKKPVWRDLFNAPPAETGKSR